MCQADPRLLVAALSSDDIDVLLVIIGILRSMTSSAENRSIADCTTVRLMDERLKRFIEAGGLASVIAVLAHGRRRQWMHAPRAVTKKAALLDAHLLRVGMTLDAFYLFLANVCGVPQAAARVKRIPDAKDVALFSLDILRGKSPVAGREVSAKLVCEAAALFLLNMTNGLVKSRPPPILTVLNCDELSCQLVAVLKADGDPSLINNVLCALCNLQMYAGWQEHARTLPLFSDLLKSAHAHLGERAETRVLSAAADLLVYLLSGDGRLEDGSPAPLSKDACVEIVEAIADFVQGLSNQDVIDILALMRHDNASCARHGHLLVRSICALRGTFNITHSVLHDVSFTTTLVTDASLGSICHISLEPQLDDSIALRAMQLKWSSNIMPGGSNTVGAENTAEFENSHGTGTSKGTSKGGVVMQGNRCFNLACETHASDDGAILRCSRCLQAWYCSQECQAADWKQHKKTCKRPAAS